MSDLPMVDARERTTGKELNDQWRVGAAHALYHADGTWYHYLKTFPGALFDAEGYVIFHSEEEYRGSPFLQFGGHVHVPTGIASMPAYVRVGSELLEDEETYASDTGSIYPYKAPEELDIRPENNTVYEWLRKLDRETLKIDPEFQRSLVWHISQKCSFIESVLLNIPLPPIYVNQDAEGNLILVDGLQRTTALAEYVQHQSFRLSGLSVMPDLNGHRFSELPPRLQRRIEDRQLLIYVIKPSVPPNLVYDIFHRINTGGTQLTRQEVRNCLFIGEATRLLKRLANGDAFKAATGLGISPRRMKDQEAVLRCLAFYLFDYRAAYHGDMDAFVAEALRLINRSDLATRAQLEDVFNRTMRQAFTLFGADGFRLPTSSTRGRVNIAVMESVFLALAHREPQAVQAEQDAIVRGYKTLISDPLYLEAVRYSTGDTRKVITRFQMAETWIGKP